MGSKAGCWKLLLEGVKVSGGNCVCWVWRSCWIWNYLFVCVGPQFNNSLEELYLASNKLTDEFTTDDNFIHLGKLKMLGLSSESFSEAGIAAISPLLQVQFPLICLFAHCDRLFVLIPFQTPLSLCVFLVCFLVTWVCWLCVDCCWSLFICWLIVLDILSGWWWQ